MEALAMPEADSETSLAREGRGAPLVAGVENVCRPNFRKVIGPQACCSRNRRGDRPVGLTAPDALG